MYYLFIIKIHTICSLPVQTTDKHFPSHHELVSTEGINHVSGIKATYEHISSQGKGYWIWALAKELGVPQLLFTNTAKCGTGLAHGFGVIVDMLVYGDRRHA